MKYNVRKLPEEKLFKFDNNKYIMSHKTIKTKGGQTFSNPINLTYVISFDDNMKVDEYIVGYIVDKMLPYDSSKEFIVVDYDTEETHEFKIVIPLEEVSESEKLNVFVSLMESYDRSKKRK